VKEKLILCYIIYFKVSPDSEEPEILNTPRSIVPPSNCINNNNSGSGHYSHLYNLRRRSRNLFQSTKKEGYDNVPESIEETNDSVSQTILVNPTKPPPIITDM
jgi:hypothetical protein